jgi:hypothetical protein
MAAASYNSSHDNAGLRTKQQQQQGGYGKAAAAFRSSYANAGLGTSQQQQGRPPPPQQSRPSPPQQQQQQHAGQHMPTGFDPYPEDELKFIMLAKFSEQVAAGNWAQCGKELGEAPKEFYMRPKVKGPAPPVPPTGPNPNTRSKPSRDEVVGIFEPWKVDVM